MYLSLLLFWGIVIVCYYNSTYKIKSTKFDNSISNYIYKMSFFVPFKWFVADDEDLSAKDKEIEQKLITSGFLRYFTVRSFMALKIIIFMCSLTMSGIIIIMMKNFSNIVHVVFNLEAQINFSTNSMIGVIVFFLILALCPNLILTYKVRKSILLHNKDIPIIQMFIILLLRSNKTIGEILFALSKIQTYHRKNFEQGYRMYLRNKNDGIEFLKTNFVSEKFVETFDILNNMYEYSREDSIQLLEGNLDFIISENNELKRRNDLSKLIYSQASMVLPFLAIILFGAVPIIIKAMNIFSASGITAK